MDREDLRSVLTATGVDLWTLIETAISVAAAEHGAELRLRRDGFVERLYAPPLPPQGNSSGGGDRIQMEAAFEAEKMRSRAAAAAREEEKGSSSPIEKLFGSSPLTPQSNHRNDVAKDEEDEDVDIDDDRRSYEPPVLTQEQKIFSIKESLEDLNQVSSR